MKILEITLATVLFLSLVQVALFQEIDDEYSDIQSDVHVIDSEQDAYDLEAAFGDSYYSNEYDYANGDPENDRATMKPMDTALIAIYSIITVVGLIANAVVFFVIFAGNETGKTVTAIYILQLTVADTVFLFSLPVFSMQKVLDKWTFGDGVCTLCQTIKFMNYYAGIFFLMTMSVDRYIAVAYSTRLTQIRTKQRTYIACVCMWCAAVVMSIPAMMYARTEDHFGVVFCKVLFPGYKEPKEEDKFVHITLPASGSGDLNSTEFEFEYSTEDLDEDFSFSEGFGKPFVCDHASQSQLYKSWLVINFVVAFAIPFLVIVVSYLKILTHLKTAEHKIGHTATNKAAKTRKRVTRMVAALVICFTVCWLPHHIFMLAKIRGFPTTVPVCQGIEQFFIALAFSNSAINPLLYTFMGNNFKERFRKSVKNTQRAIRRHSSRSSTGTGRRKSANSHSDHTNGKKSGGFIVHYRKQSSNQPGYPNGQQQNQAALLGNRRDRGLSYDPETNGQTEFCATTSIGEQTLETKI